MAEEIDTVAFTAEIVGAYSGHNRLSPSEIAPLIAVVHRALASLGGPAAPVEVAKVPAISVRKSLQQYHLICLECGAKQKTLKRHLLSSHDLSPQAYRTKWHLPEAYPMVSPDYAAQRSALALSMGLGRGGFYAKPAEHLQEEVSRDKPPEPPVEPVASRKSKVAATPPEAAPRPAKARKPRRVPAKPAK